MEDEKKTKLIDFVLKEKDIKYLDAIEVLEYIKNLEWIELKIINRMT